MTLLSEAAFAIFNTWLMFNQHAASTLNAELTALSHGRFYNVNKLQGLLMELNNLPTGRQLVLDYISNQRLSDSLFQVPYGYHLRPTVIDGSL